MLIILPALGSKSIGQFFRSDDNITQREIDSDNESDSLSTLESDPEDASGSSATTGPSDSVRSSRSITNSDSTATNQEPKRVRMDWKPAWRDKSVCCPSIFLMFSARGHLRSG